VSVAALLARALYEQGQNDDAARLVATVEEEASKHDLWSQVLFRLTHARLLADAGHEPEAEAKAREALAIVDRTDLLDLRGDVLLDLGDVLRRAGREDEARECSEQALALYERKGDIVSSDKARAILGASITPV